MKIMYCSPNLNDHKYYCSTKTKYPTEEPKKCDLILDHDSLFEYIKNNRDKYIYQLPFLVAKDFRRRLESRF